MDSDPGTPSAVSRLYLRLALIGLAAAAPAFALLLASGSDPRAAAGAALLGLGLSLLLSHALVARRVVAFARKLPPPELDDPSPAPSGAGPFSRIELAFADLGDALRDERLFGAALLDTAGALVLLLDREGRVLRVNRAAAELAGVAPAEAVGRPFWDVFLPASRREEARAGFLALRPGDGPVQTEGHWLGRDGSLRRIRWSHSIFADAAGALSVGIDVTESRALEAQLRQAQKMEALGRIAAGIAHDFNNLLTVVTGYSELLQGLIPAAAPERSHADAIHEAAARGALLTRQLLTFARKQVVEPVPLDLNEIVSRLERSLLRLLGEDVRLETRLQTALGAVLADPGQLEQVILNLAVNARDAMPEGGRLLLATERADLDAVGATSAGLPRAGPYAILSVSDTGHGMDASVRARLFEPFFTTKPPEQGTGLGLSMVYGIVKQAGGAVGVDSSPGQGAIFRILLPITAAAPRPAPAAAAEAASRGGAETVLVVEDAEAVRLLMRRVLETLGYSVLAAADGEAALRVSWEHRGPLHLLVTDLVMPSLGGRELARLLCLSRPETRVLFASGHPEELPEGGALLLRKPFSPGALAAKVREVLDRPPEPAR